MSEQKNTYGLIGYRLGYSFSKNFFTEKFKNEGKTDHEYLNFELDSIDEFPTIFEKHPNVKGLNCTIPYKQDIIPFMDEIEEETAQVGAVNTVKPVFVDGQMKLIGYNTDIIGFERALAPMLNENHKKALILGTGGASKAIKHILKKLGLTYISASIEDVLNENEIPYEAISEQIITEHTVIINATPLGTHPNVDQCAPIPYEFISSDHVLFDLVYNPEITLFMKKGMEQGAQVKNGLEMLHGQAIASWEIWNR